MVTRTSPIRAPIRKWPNFPTAAAVPGTALPPLTSRFSVGRKRVNASTPAWQIRPPAVLSAGQLGSWAASGDAAPRKDNRRRRRIFILLLSAGVLDIVGARAGGPRDGQNAIRIPA